MYVKKKKKKQKKERNTDVETPSDRVYILLYEGRKRRRVGATHLVEHCCCATRFHIINNDKKVILFGIPHVAETRTRHVSSSCAIYTISMCAFVY